MLFYLFLRIIFDSRNGRGALDSRTLFFIARLVIKIIQRSLRNKHYDGFTKLQLTVRVKWVQFDTLLSDSDYN